MPLSLKEAQEELEHEGNLQPPPPVAAIPPVSSTLPAGAHAEEQVQCAKETAQSPESSGCAVSPVSGEDTQQGEAMNMEAGEGAIAAPHAQCHEDTDGARKRKVHMLRDDDDGQGRGAGEDGAEEDGGASDTEHSDTSALSAVPTADAKMHGANRESKLAHESSNDTSNVKRAPSPSTPATRPRRELAGFRLTKP